MTTPNFGDKVNADDIDPETTNTQPGYVSLEQLNEILAARDKQHADQLAAMKSKLPVAMVPQHSGGPGIDQHQASWSLAEQQAASRGEMLDHWVIQD